MADTADLRSEGKSSDTQAAQTYRRLKAARQAAGFCVVCGKVPVKNRVTCYSCVDAQVVQQNRYGFRRVLAEYGVTKERYNDLVNELEASGLAEQSELISNLLDALFDNKYKHK